MVFKENYLFLTTALGVYFTLLQASGYYETPFTVPLLGLLTPPNILTIIPRRNIITVHYINLSNSKYTFHLTQHNIYRPAGIHSLQGYTWVIPISDSFKYIWWLLCIVSDFSNVKNNNYYNNTLLGFAESATIMNLECILMFHVSSINSILCFVHIRNICVDMDMLHKLLYNLLSCLV